eukprot:TRINITY_DN5236_c0_g1_i1.p1 TRINITY_DN5236_c0_g1~~TRINITY_DN5236_c0_g1_i1.p1  ORF type:complete len:356 (+),score=8.23 TRINITY_DN5236_c0_g1_i1:23-1069(+)
MSSSSLPNVPYELVELIADFVQQSSLSLTCKRFWEAIGCRFFVPFKESSGVQDPREFIARCPHLGNLRSLSTHDPTQPAYGITSGCRFLLSETQQMDPSKWAEILQQVASRAVPLLHLDFTLMSFDDHWAITDAVQSFTHLEHLHITVSVDWESPLRFLQNKTHLRSLDIGIQPMSTTELEPLLELVKLERLSLWSPGRVDEAAFLEQLVVQYAPKCIHVLDINSKTAPRIQLDLFPNLRQVGLYYREQTKSDGATGKCDCLPHSNVELHQLAIISVLLQTGVSATHLFDSVADLPNLHLLHVTAPQSQAKEIQESAVTAGFHKPVRFTNAEKGHWPPNPHQGILLPQ